MTRFGGAVEPFGPVDIVGMVDWITAIPFSEWPQQTPIDHQLRPAMVNDRDWHHFSDHGVHIVWAVLERYGAPYPITQNWMLSVVMPGHHIDWHEDRQDDAWLVRIHVPLITNPQCAMGFDEGLWHLTPGMAYKVNPTRRHAIYNSGETPRIHFMFDLVKG